MHRSEQKQKKALDVIINIIVKYKYLNLKVLPEWILDMMYFDVNGPSNLLSTISIYYYLNCQEKHKSSHKGTAVIPFRKMLKITRDVGFLCQVERMRRKRVLDYDINMSRIFEPDTKIKITKGPSFYKSPDKTLLS
ncbi:MAG: hypothetical protein JW871_09005 [Endomicrobiales bacterium]|nr:hypothetical protein [Endomicrobiales bacterium]